MAISSISSVAKTAFQSAVQPQTQTAAVDPSTSAAAAGTDTQTKSVTPVSTSTQTGEGNANGEESNNDKSNTDKSYLVTNENIKKAVEEINKNMNNSEAIFGIHDKTNRVTIKIIDKETKKVIKEFPPEKTLDMIAKVWEMAGLMVDEKR